MCRRFKTFWVYCGIALIAMATIAGCGASGEVEIADEDSGSEVALKTGQRLVVSLASNPTTGYRWEVVLTDDGVLAQVGEATFSEDKRAEGLIGAGGTETLHFEAKRTGRTTLELACHRPWEEEAKPIETYTVQVVVE